jgi:hypothetical protein
MNRADLLAVWEARRADAELHGATAPVARIYTICIDEMRQLDGNPHETRMLSTEETAKVLGVVPRTVARYCKEGRLKRARKSSDDSGKWLIPSDSVYAEIGMTERRQPHG